MATSRRSESKEQQTIFAPKITDRFLRFISSTHCKMTELDLSHSSYEYIDAQTKFERQVGQPSLDDRGVSQIDLKEEYQATPPSQSELIKVIDSLKKNASLRVLDCSEIFNSNSYADDTADAFSSLMDMIKNNRSLQKIIFNDCTFTVAQMNKLLMSIRLSTINAISFQRACFPDLLKLKELIEVMGKREQFNIDLTHSNCLSLLNKLPHRIGIAFQLLRKKRGLVITFDCETEEYLDTVHEKRMTYPPKRAKQEPIVASHHFSFISQFNPPSPAVPFMVSEKRKTW